MEAALKQGIDTEIGPRILTALSVFKISNIEKILSYLLENVEDDSPLNYIGELNRYDLMH
ncbi:hypothetical protein IJ596_03000 [bacterium]|nr:hypothetical protein [bacterium]